MNISRTVFLLVINLLTYNSLIGQEIDVKKWPKFEDIEWGTSKEAVTKSLEVRGYKKDPQSGENNAVFSAAT